MKKNSTFVTGGLFVAYFALFALVAWPTSEKEKFVALSAEVVPKTVMITVIANVEQVRLYVTPDGLELKKSTVTVQIRGSGVLISPRGHVLTCKHLINEGEILSITIKTFDGYEHKGDVLAVDTQNDLSLMRIYENTPDFAKLADPRKFRVGQEVIAVGNPLGLEFSVTHGIISALNRDIAHDYNVTQSDTFINPGNSGGPLFNIHGELVGINVFMIPPINSPVFTGNGFSVQTGQIIEFLTKYKNKYEGLPAFNKGYWK